MSTGAAAFAGLPASAWVRGRVLRSMSSLASPPPAFLRRGRAARGAARMSGESAEDEAPSDSYVPPGEEAAAALVGDPADADAAERRRVLSGLLTLCATTGRGQLASAAQKDTVDDAVARLEELSPVAEPVNSDLIDGTWMLLYTNAQLFRTNPFLAAAATPLLDVGQVRQTIDVGAGKISTEVDVVAFPATSGKIRTSARITPVGAERIEVVVEKTSVVGGMFAERVDLGGISFDVPVESIYSRIRGSSPETYFDTYYLDENVRVSRSKAGSLYIYAKE